MGREVRMVPAGWEHPRDARGYIPLSKTAMMGLIPKCQRTHVQMYETSSGIMLGDGPRGRGTPISPEFATPEELARWLTDNRASWHGSRGGSYEQWLAVIVGRRFIVADTTGMTDLSVKEILKLGLPVYPPFEGPGRDTSDWASLARGETAGRA